MKCLVCNGMMLAQWKGYCHLCERMIHQVGDVKKTKQHLDKMARLKRLKWLVNREVYSRKQIEKPIRNISDRVVYHKARVEAQLSASERLKKDGFLI